jgi:threonine dehydrogenase-like Zn-dependent dehydrogenase
MAGHGGKEGVAFQCVELRVGDSRDRCRSRHVSQKRDLAEVVALVCGRVHAPEVDIERALDRVGRLDDVPDGYRAMNEREAIKVMVEL